jgi:hypothetical protein
MADGKFKLDSGEALPLCLCGCGRVIHAPAHLRGVKKFASDACRQRWHSARRQLALQALKDRENVK